MCSELVNKNLYACRFGQPLSFLRVPLLQSVREAPRGLQAVQPRGACDLPHWHPHGRLHTVTGVSVLKALCALVEARRVCFHDPASRCVGDPARGISLSDVYSGALFT